MAFNSFFKFFGVIYFKSRFSILNNEMGGIYYATSDTNVSGITLRFGKKMGDFPLLWYLSVGIWNNTVSTGAIGTVRCNGFSASQSANILVNGQYNGANLVASATVNSLDFTVALRENCSYVKLVVFGF